MSAADRLSALQQDAEQQREQLHASAESLRAKVAVTRDKLLPANLAREHFLVISGIAAGIALTFGYFCGGAFVRK